MKKLKLPNLFSNILQGNLSGVTQNDVNALAFCRRGNNRGGERRVYIHFVGSNGKKGLTVRKKQAIQATRNQRKHKQATSKQGNENDDDRQTISFCN